MEVLILTGDRDSLQLVSDDATVLYPMRGVSDLARMTPQAVEAKYGVPPQRYPELAAIVGETSDNLPGVPGVGQGFAAKWINQYDGLDNVIAHADEITGKKGEALREHLGDVIRNRRLNALVCDLDLEHAPADLVLGPWDRQQAAHALRRPRVPGELRDPHHSTPSSPRRTRSTRAASSWPGGDSVPARWPTSSAGSATSTSASTSVATGGAGTGDGRGASRVADISGPRRASTSPG